MASRFQWKRLLRRSTDSLHGRRHGRIHGRRLRCEPLEPRQLLTTFADGANMLIAGNSFLVPVAEPFSGLAHANGYTDHTTDAYFVGGQAGTVGELWDNHPEEITTKLEAKPDRSPQMIWRATALVSTNHTAKEA
ncbi:MAG: hypothetical protein AAGD07_14135 [Planctomycetota bacterium]